MEQSEPGKKTLEENVDPVTIGPGGDATTLDTTHDTPHDTTHDTTHDRPQDSSTTEGKEGSKREGESQGSSAGGDLTNIVNPEMGSVKQDTKEESDLLQSQEGAVELTAAEDTVNKNEPEETSQVQAKNKGSIHVLLERNLARLSRSERTTLYEAGIKLHASGEADEALACLLGAITGLGENTAFSDLPKCLHAVADIYFDKKEYEKAVYFIQAEKMYYETALIDLVSVENQTGDEKERKRSQGDGDEKEDATTDEQPGEEANADDPSREQEDDLSPDAKKGQEFENLARLCLKEGKLQLALEYCGKATKMYQAVYGEEHPVTVAALDLFTVIYADVGKKLYTDAMQKFEKEEEELAAEKSHDVTSQTPDTELRHRGPNNKEVDGESQQATQRDNTTQPHAGEFEPVTETERDDWVMTILLMIIFFLVTVFIAILLSSVYCYNNAKSKYCAQTRGEINYWYMYARHLVHDFRKSFR